MAAFAVARYRFFGRETISFLVILPIALPGIVTGIALNNAFRTILGPIGSHLGLATVIVGHATFCIVVVYNNVLARLRRTGTSLEEASADLGRRHVPDLPPGHLPGGALGAVRRRAARLRAVLRRDHRDDVHRRPGRADPADLDLRQPVPAQPGAGRQRRRRGAGRAVVRAGLAGRSGSGWARAPAAGSRRPGDRLQPHFVPVARRTRPGWRRIRRLRRTKWVGEGSGRTGQLPRVGAWTAARSAGQVAGSSWPGAHSAVPRKPEARASWNRSRTEAASENHTVWVTPPAR